MTSHSPASQAETLSSLQRLSRLTPRDAAVWRRLGYAHLSHGEWEAAAASYRSSIELEPECARAHNNLGQALMRLERRTEAIASYRRATQLAPEHASAHNNLGIALCEEGEIEAGLESYRRALALDPKLAEAHHNYGNALLRLQRPQEALQCYDRALVLKPESVAVLAAKGDALASLQRLDEALAAYESGIQRDPRDARLLGKAARVLLELRQPLRALDYRERALRHEPHSPVAHAKRASILNLLCRFEDSLECSQRAIALRPDYPQALASRAFALRQLHRYEEALATCERALGLDPDLLEPACTRAEVLFAMGQQAAARECILRILEVHPDRADMRTLLLMNHIPHVPLSGDEMDAARLEFTARFGDFERWIEANPQLEAETVVGSATPFSLAYQETSNLELLTRHGKLCRDLMSRWQQRNEVKVPGGAARPTNKLRVGIVSAHIRDHSVYRALVRGWLGQLDRHRLEIGVLHVGGNRDGETLWAQAHANFFVEGVRPLHEWIEAIRSLSLDVLLYPEIGMHKLTLQLASLRLAPHQLAAWGHPETTGLPTMDHYLSAQCFEPPEAQDYYCEKLVPLANLGCYYEPYALTPAAVDLRRRGIDSRRTLFVCAGMPFKYAPRHDHVFPEIARRVGHCQFVFFTAPMPRLTDNLQERLRAAFRDRDLEPADYLVFVPWQQPAEFFGLMRQASVFLDTLGFSGFNTVMQAIECDLPVVTFEGRFMRGRLGSGIMRRAELTDLVANTSEEYVALAVRLATDEDFRQDVRRRMESGKGRLFRDGAAIDSFAEFLTGLNSRPTPSSGSAPP